jgi:hypothetical protein
VGVTPRIVAGGKTKTTDGRARFSFFFARVCGDANEVRESSLLSLGEREKALENYRRVYLSLCIQNF